MEVDVQTSIITFFKFLRAWTFKAMVSSRNGTPDVIACVPITKAEADKLFETQDVIGLFVAVEVKDKHKKAEGRKLQEIQLRRIRAAGGIGLTANSLDLVKKALSQFRL